MITQWLAEVRARLEAATPGPWLSTLCLFEGAAIDRNKARENAELIAHAPTDLARALAVIEVLREALIRANEYSANIKDDHSPIEFIEDISREALAKADAVMKR